MKFPSALFRLPGLLGLLNTLALGLLLYGKINPGLLCFLLAACAFAFGFLRLKTTHSHGAFLSIDYYAAHSPLSACSPLLKMGVALASIFACLLSSSVQVYVFVFAAMLACAVLWGKAPLGYYLSLLLLPVTFISLSSVAIAVQLLPQSSIQLENHLASYLLTWPAFGFYLGITPQSQSSALLLAARAIAAVSCLYMLSLTTPLPAIMAVLRRLKLPALAIDLLYLTYRYIFILLKLNEQLLLAATSRLGYRTFKTGLKSALLCASTLLFLSWREADNNYTAMLARGYNGDICFWEAPPPAKPLAFLTGTIYLIFLLGLYFITR